MTCPNCGLHSFIQFGFLEKGITLVYSSPAKSKETPQDLTVYKNHFAAMNGRWLWIIDFEGMQAKHYTSLQFTRELVDMITREQDRLVGIYLINPNNWLRMTMKTMSAVLPKGFREKLRLFETTGTGLLLEIERSGIDRANVLQLLEQLRSKT